MSGFPPLTPKVEITNRDSCPVWTQVGGTIYAKSNLETCFPSKYFDWAVGHLRELVAQPPPAHPQSQLFWALDCWSTLNYVMFSFNCPQYSPFAMFDGYGAPSSALAGTLWDASSLSHRIYEVMTRFWPTVLQGQKNELMAIKKAGAGPAYLDAASKPPQFYAAPFTSFVPWWFLGPTRGTNANYGNDPVEDIVTAKVLPWMTGGLTLGSKGNKDSADLSKGATDMAWLSAVYGWRLWSLRDFSPWSAWRSGGWQETTRLGPTQQVPRGMGSYENMATMSKYLEYLQGESRYPKVEFDGNGKWFPNLAFVIQNALIPAAQQAIGTYYATEVKTWISVWSARAEPKMGPDGQPAKMADIDRYEPVPVTCEDYIDLDKQQTSRVEDRSRKTSAEMVDNPALGCKELSGMAKTQCERAAAYYANTMNSVPFVKAFASITKKIFALFTKFAPMAVGWSYLPFIPIGPLFTRAIDVLGYRAVPNGSSSDVLLRMRIAVTAIANELQLNIAPWAAPLGVGLVAGNVTIDPEGNAVFQAAPAANAPWSRARCETEADKALVIMKTNNPTAKFVEADRKAIADCCVAVLVTRTNVDQGACLKKVAQIIELRKTQAVGPEMHVPELSKKGRYTVASGTVVAAMLLGIRGPRR